MSLNKAKLAKFAGGTIWWSHESSGQPSEPGWLFEQLKPSWPVIMQDAWNPLTPAHGWLVLRALVEKMGWGWVREEVFMVGRKANKPDKDASWFWPAVRQAALEIIAAEACERGLEKMGFKRQKGGE